MDKSKKFLDFCKLTPPPCLPDEKLYWFNSDTGEIKQDMRSIEGLALTSDWEWRIIDDDENWRIPNESEYCCLTPEDAKKFRDQLTSVKYAVFRKSDTGNIIGASFDGDRVEEKYEHFKTATIDVRQMKLTEGYFEYIMRTDEEVKPGMALQFCIEETPVNDFYFVINNDKAVEGRLYAETKVGKRELEDIFD